MLHEQQRQIIKELEVPILKVIHDEHGNHVVQVVLELGDRQAIDFVFKCIRGKVKELSSNRYGCRVVQKAIEFGTPADKASIIEEVHASARDLINNEFGNYVIQHVLESAERYGRPEDVTRIINTIRGKVVAYSKEKYASNVIEKCDKHGTPEQVLQIEAELVAREPNGEESQLRGMIVHQYANYVISESFRLAFLPGPCTNSSQENMQTARRTDRPTWKPFGRIGNGRRTTIRRGIWKPLRNSWKAPQHGGGKQRRPLDTLQLPRPRRCSWTSVRRNRRLA